MKRFPKLLMSAAFLTLGTGQGFAFEQEVSNVWWAVYDNYNGSNQTACVAENYNDHPVDAVFDVFPGAPQVDGAPAPSRMVVTMAPYRQYKLFGWVSAAGPGQRCDLRSFTVHVD